MTRATQGTEATMMWDPFAGDTPFSQQQVKKPSSNIKLPAFLNSLAGFMILAGFALCFVAILYVDAMWIGVPTIMLGFTLLFLYEHFNKTDANIDWLLFQLAQKHNWAMELIPRTASDKEMARQLLAEKTGKTIQRDMSNKYNPRILPIHERVGDLLKVKVGRVTMLEFNAFFRGKTSQAIPFWMGVGMIQADMSLAAGELKRDAYGNVGNQAYMIQMLCAYQLDRDTGIRARLLHESVLGESKRDFQTESVEFNRLFNISLADKNGKAPEDAESQHQALLQALTPATQASLIELKEKYDIQLVIEGDTVFYAGWTKLNSPEFDIIEQHLHGITEAFAQSAVSFKHYVE